MIFITAKFRVLPEYADQWSELTRGFTIATRTEEGCLWFDWSRSLDNPLEYVLVEAFRDSDAGKAHVDSEHFKRARETLPAYLSHTPLIVNFDLPGSDWFELGELRVSR